MHREEERDWAVAWLWLLTAGTARAELVRDKIGELQQKARRSPSNLQHCLHLPSPYPSCSSYLGTPLMRKWRRRRKDEAQDLYEGVTTGKERRGARTGTAEEHQGTVDSDWIETLTKSHYQEFKEVNDLDVHRSSGLDSLGVWTKLSEWRRDMFCLGWRRLPKTISEVILHQPQVGFSVISCCVTCSRS